MIGMLPGYFITTFRMSMGDFDFDPTTYINYGENVIFWIIWTASVVMSTIVFLNFIIAEVGNSYQKIKDRLESEIFKNKTSLVSEAETMISQCHRNEINFPKYIVIREIEE